MWRNLIEVRDSLDERTGFNPYLEDGELSAGQAAAYRQYGEKNIFLL